jgi:uncharacterized protein (UPF0332 family)/predicted nucleotidyltransferase
MTAESPTSVSAHQAAVEYFRQILLGDGGKDRIAKLILFGSAARGEATPESDVDLLVLATDDLDEVSQACAEASLRTAVEMHISVEPLVYCLDQLRQPHSLFVANAIATGKEIYSMAEPDLSRAEARGFLNLAQIYREGAERALATGDPRIAVDLAYNAAELCVKGLLVLRGESIPRTHAGVITRFGELFVRQGLISETVGRDLHLGLERRNKARYDWHAEISERDATGSIAVARVLGEHLDALLSEASSG